jgi:Fe2+ or Zn2+ uptake regulation protein
MASNQGKRSLDKSTRNTLTALEKALEMSSYSPLSDDEFTAQQYIDEMTARDPNITPDGCRHTLTRLVEAGKLTVRKARVNGKQCNAYRLK